MPQIATMFLSPSSIFFEAPRALRSHVKDWVPTLIRLGCTVAAERCSYAAVTLKTVTTELSLLHSHLHRGVACTFHDRGNTEERVPDFLYAYAVSPSQRQGAGAHLAPCERVHGRFGPSPAKISSNSERTRWPASGSRPHENGPPNTGIRHT